MTDIALVRVDSRLVHGQVTTGYLRTTRADHILVIDDKVKADPFLTQINQMATTVPCEVMSVDEAVAEWKKDQLANRGILLIIFQYIGPACRAYTEGFNFPLLQLGNISGGPGRKNIVGPITLIEDEAHMLNELYKQGMGIEFRANLDNPAVPWQPTISKAFPSVK